MDQLDAFVLEVYHKTNSTFPGLLRRYDFEANYHYDTFYKDEFKYPPIITNLLNAGGTVRELYTVEHINQSHNAYNNLNIPMRNIYKINLNLFLGSLTIIEANSIEEAKLIHKNQIYFHFPQNMSKMFVQYQNLVITIRYYLPEKEQVLETLFGDVEYEIYGEEDISNRWE